MPSVLRCSVALLLLLGVACSSGSKESADKGSTTTTSTTTTTIKSLAVDEVDASKSPYCSTWAAIRKLGNPVLDGNPQQVVAARKAYYAKLAPLAEKLLTQAEASIKPQVQYAVDQVKEVAATGSDAPFNKPEAAPTQQKLASYALEHCAK